MYATPTMVDHMLRTALAAAKKGNQSLYQAIEQLPAAIYVTDVGGFITFFNSACIDFAGRKPVLGQDQWCVTWKLYTNEGDFLPHAECPMAQAIKTGKSVRGMTAVAERPDGTRVNFLPYPTPLLDGSGQLIGAINILIDVTDVRQASFLMAQAEKSRRLAWSCSDERVSSALLNMADEYEAKAKTLNSRSS